MGHSDKNRLGQLRERAEVVLAEMGENGTDQLAIKDVTSVLHDLSVHQIELEMQNEELLKVQSELQRTQNEYEDLYHHAPVGYLTLNQQGMILKHNQTFSAIWENGEQKFVGEPFSKLIDSQDRDIFISRYKAFFKNPRSKKMDLRLNPGNGSLIWVRLSGRTHVVSSPHEENQQILLLTVADIDGEKLAELERLSVEQQLQQLQRLESIGTLAAGVAHEINNPLGFISSNLRSLDAYIKKLISFSSTTNEIIESFDSNDLKKQIEIERKKLKIDYILEDVKDLLDESIDGTDRVKKIVQDLKTFSRAESTDCSLIDINNCLDSTLTIAHNELKYKASILKEYGKIPLTYCFPQQLGQVFLNLLINAGHAIETEGEITIKTSAEANQIHISITDTGQGISPESISRIFEPFYTTKEVGKGTGLGLSISYDIIKKHNGHLSVVSQLGKGTTFTIQLPVQTDEFIIAKE